MPIKSQDIRAKNQDKKIKTNTIYSTLPDLVCLILFILMDFFHVAAIS